MRLVIEREGGYLVVETDELVVIDVMSHGVKLKLRDGNTSVVECEDHAAACRLSAAIAVRCGELVEPLAGAPGNGLEDAEDDDAMGAVMAGRIRKPASEWVDGEPPRDGRWYVAMRDDSTLPRCHRWDEGLGRWVDSEGWKVNGGTEAHLPTPIPNR